MKKIPYKLIGCGDVIFELIKSDENSGFFDSCFYSEGKKSISEASPVSKKELDRKIIRLEQELKFLKSFKYT